MSGDTTNRDFVSFRLDQAKTDNALSLYVGSSAGSQVIQETGPVLGPILGEPERFSISGAGSRDRTDACPWTHASHDQVHHANAASTWTSSCGA